jgi:hypothetical protein
VLGVDADVAHPVGLDLQRGFPAVGREVEVIDGAILVGVGVVRAAVAKRGAVHIARQQLLGALEHQVFEVVR